MRSLPLRWRVIALLTVLAVLLVVDASLAAQYNARLVAEQQQSDELIPVEEVPEDLVLGLLDQQVSVRGFAATGDERLLDTYENRQDAEGLAIARLREQFRAGRPELMLLLDRVAESATVWHRRVAEPVIRFRREGDARTAVRLISTRDDRLFRPVRRDGMALAAAVDQQLSASRVRVGDASDRLDQHVMTSSMIGLLFVVASGVLLRRWLTRPVADLSEQVRRVAAGRLHERIRASGPGEFRLLGLDVETMRRRILDELEESRRAFEALQQNAPLVASLRTELVSPSADLPETIALAARFEPAEGVLAGDWVQTVRLEDDRVGLVMVDVSGHGAEAGLRALWLKHLLVPAMRLELEPADALHWAVGQLGDTEEWFATCLVVDINSASGECLYANAGHPPALVVGRGGVRELEPTGPLLSDLPGARWVTERLQLTDDEVLVVYTDGLTEARAESGEEFGHDRLLAYLREAAGQDVHIMADRLMDTVHAFASGRLADDATLVVAGRQAAPYRTGPAAGGMTGSGWVPR